MRAFPGPVRNLPPKGRMAVIAPPSEGRQAVGAVVAEGEGVVAVALPKQEVVGVQPPPPQPFASQLHRRSLHRT